MKCVENDRAMTNFGFLSSEWPDLFDAANKAESLARPDPRTSCFYARRGLELAVHWLYKSDVALRLPHSDSLSALLFEPTFRDAIGSARLTKARIIKDLGNLAVHSYKPIREIDAISAVRELFHFCFWIARTYARGAKPPDGIQFRPELFPSDSAATQQTIAQLQKLEEQLREKDERLVELLEGRKTLDEELEGLRAEIAAAKKANAAKPDEHDYSEAETRDYFIDLLLKEAGWPLTETRDREFPVSGMPNEKKEGLSIMSSGATTVSRLDWSKQSGRSGTPVSVSSRQSFMPIAWKRNLVTAQSSSIPMGISIGCGTMSVIPRVRFRVSIRKPSWSC